MFTLILVIRVFEPFNLNQSDICEFEGTLTRNRKRYSITFIDDYSNFFSVYRLKNKTEARDMFKFSSMKLRIS